MLGFVMVLPTEVSDKAKADVERVRRRIAKEKDPTRAAIIAHRFQQSIIEELEERALEWADSRKPDIRIVAVPLAWLQHFRYMLRSMPKPRKRKRKPKR